MIDSSDRIAEIVRNVANPKKGNHPMRPSNILLTTALTVAGSTPGLLALAQMPSVPSEAEQTAPPQVTPPPLGYWLGGVHLWAQVEAGITGNPQNPASGVNYGQPFTDRANQPLL